MPPMRTHHADRPLPETIGGHIDPQVASGMLKNGTLGTEVLRLARAAVGEHRDQASRLRELCALAEPDRVLPASGGTR